MKNSNNSSSNTFFDCFTMGNPTIASPNCHTTTSRGKSRSSETAEPSSPKVTCIGQVKIKSKRKKSGNNNQHLVNRSRSSRETRSFRQREVKAVSICDALSCFMPAFCGGWNSCYNDSSGSNKKEQGKLGGDKGRKRYSCGAVFFRWLMAVDEEEEEEGKKARNLNDFREMDFFVRGEETEDDLENAFSKKKEEEEVEANVCIPPKNALLLMRCRSDPVRMAALSSRFWDSPMMKVDGNNDDDDGEVEVEKIEKGVVLDEVVKIEEYTNAIEEYEVDEGEVLEKIVECKGVDEVKKALKDKDEREEGEIVLRRSFSCSTSGSIELSKLKEGEKRRSFSYREKEKRRDSFSVEKESKRHSFCSEKEARRSSFSVNNNKESKKGWSCSVEKENFGFKDKSLVLHSLEEANNEETTPREEESIRIVDQLKIESSKKEETRIAEKEKKHEAIPECLVSMMYEPKLSMEVSKETWICDTDFVHQRRNQHPNPKHECNAKEGKIKVEDHHAENKNTIAVVHQTPPELTSLISPMEQKLLKSLAISALPQARHLVLTRCKSEPGKSSARLVADTSFWKARHQPIGTAALGF